MRYAVPVGAGSNPLEVEVSRRNTVCQLVPRSADEWEMSNTLLQHVFAGERLQAFSDAVFSIIATIMVRPRAEIKRACRGGQLVP